MIMSSARDDVELTPINETEEIGQSKLSKKVAQRQKDLHDATIDRVEAGATHADVANARRAIKALEAEAAKERAAERQARAELDLLKAEQQEYAARSGVIKDRGGLHPVAALNRSAERAIFERRVASSIVLDDGTLVLPRVPGDRRAMGNLVLRTPLFRPGRAGSAGRVGYSLTVIYASGGIELLFTGTELRQDDLDVWLELLHDARDDLAALRRFRVSGLLAALGRSRSAASRHALLASLARLAGASFAVKQNAKVISLSVRLIKNFRFDGVLCSVELDENAAQLFGEHEWSSVQLPERRGLKSTLAQWLHGFFSTHARPFPLRLAYIRQQSGSAIRSDKKFKQEVRAALEELKAVNFLDDFRIEGELVSILRTKESMSAAQQRWLDADAAKLAAKRVAQ